MNIVRVFWGGLIAARSLAACGSATMRHEVDASALDGPAVVDDTPATAALTCVQLLHCVDGCADAVCAAACRARSTPQAVALLRAQVVCVFGDNNARPPVRGACPVVGGVCDPRHPTYSAALCTGCIVEAQEPGGACDGAVTACQRGR